MLHATLEGVVVVISICSTFPLSSEFVSKPVSVHPNKQLVNNIHNDSQLFYPLEGHAHYKHHCLHNACQIYFIPRSSKSHLFLKSTHDWPNYVNIFSHWWDNILDCLEEPWEPQQYSFAPTSLPVLSHFDAFYHTILFYDVLTLSDFNWNPRHFHLTQDGYVWCMFIWFLFQIILFPLL